MAIFISQMEHLRGSKLEQAALDLNTYCIIIGYAYAYTNVCTFIIYIFQAYF